MLFEGQLGKWLFWRLIAIFVRGHGGNAFAEMGVLVFEWGVK